MTKSIRSSKLHSFSNPSSSRVHPSLGDESLTKQSFKQECDINFIVNRFTQTGQLPTSIRNDGQYGYVPNMDLKDALDYVNELKDEFSSLTSEQQEMFDNDFVNYAQFLSDAEHIDFSFYLDQSGADSSSVSDESASAGQLSADDSAG